MQTRISHRLALLLTAALWLGPLSRGADIVELTILQTTDIQGAVGPTRRRRGDWLKLATLIKRERRAAGAANCLLIDCGDTFQGTFVGLVSRGEVAPLLLNHLQYDAWVPGNHDLDLGVPRFRELLGSMRVPVLNGNLYLADKGALPAWRMYDKGGARVAVIGMNASYMANWHWGEAGRGQRVTTVADEIEALMPALLQQRPDMIILALHHGWIEYDKRHVNEIRELAFTFPQIDLILGGHTHREAPGWVVNDTLYVQSGAYGEHLGRVRARIDTARHRVVALESSLLPVGKARPDPDAREAVATWLTQAETAGKQQVVRPRGQISSRGQPGRDCQVTEIFCRAMAWKTGAVAAFHGRQSAVDWEAGKWVTERDLFLALPYENTMGVAQLLPAEITAIIEEQLEFEDAFGFNGVYGLYAEIEAKRVKSLLLWRPDGVAPDPAKRLPVVFTSYALAGGGGRFVRLRQITRQPAARLQELGGNTRDAVRAYLRETPNWDAPPIEWLRGLDGGP